MTAFDKGLFTKSSGWVEYEGKFIGRFKYAKAGVGPFVTFLVKNFTQEEYFTQSAAGIPPLQILQNRGYIQPHVKKYIKQLGFPITPTGYRDCMESLYSVV